MDNHVPLDNLRLETVSLTRFCVVPYHHLELAEFESAPKREEVITLLFLNRSVRIMGRNLRVMGEALEERTVESIKPSCRERYQLARQLVRSGSQSIEIADKRDLCLIILAMDKLYIRFHTCPA